VASPPEDTETEQSEEEEEGKQTNTEVVDEKHADSVVSDSSGASTLGLES
jgi:hypothetical protein